MSWLRENWKPILGVVLFVAAAAAVATVSTGAAVLVLIVGVAGAVMTVIKSQRDAAAAADPGKEYRPAVAEDNRKTGEEAGVVYGPRGANPNPNTAEDVPSTPPVATPTPDATPSAPTPEPTPSALAAEPPSSAPATEPTPSAPSPMPSPPPPAAAAPPSAAPHPPTPPPSVAPPPEAPAPPSVAPPLSSPPPQVDMDSDSPDKPFGNLDPDPGSEAPSEPDPPSTPPPDDQTALPEPVGVPPGPEVAALPPPEAAAAPPCAAHGVPNCPACGSGMAAEPADPGRRAATSESPEEPALPPLDTGFGSGVPDDALAYATVAPATPPPALVDQVETPLVDPSVADPDPSSFPQPEPEPLGAGSDPEFADPAADSEPVADDPEVG